MRWFSSVTSSSGKVSQEPQLLKVERLDSVSINGDLRIQRLNQNPNPDHGSQGEHHHNHGEQDLSDAEQGMIILLIIVTLFALL